VNAVVAGDLELAFTTAREGVDLTRGLEESFVWTYAGVALATVLMESGEHARAIELLIRHAGGEDPSSIPAVWRTWWLDRLTRSLLAVERREAAARATVAAANIADATGLRLPVVMAQRAAAAVVLDSGDATEAARVAPASSATAGELGMPIEAATSRPVGTRPHDRRRSRRCRRRPTTRRG
jgi:hypothetical protein